MTNIFKKTMMIHRIKKDIKLHTTSAEHNEKILGENISMHRTIIEELEDKLVELRRK